MLKEFSDWFLQLCKELFTAAWDFVSDAFIAFFGMVVDAFVAVVAAMPVPSWLSAGLASVYTGLDPGILYVLTAVGLPAALAIIGGGYAFRLARKFLTLFQW